MYNKGCLQKADKEKKTMKPGCKKDKQAKSCGGIRRSREDLRQMARVRNLLAEVEVTRRKFNSLVKVATSKKFEKMAPIDRHLYKVMASALGTYYSALCMKTKFEAVRIRTESGEFLNTDFIPFFEFAGGGKLVVKEVPCDGKCKCKGKCKKECTAKC